MLLECINKFLRGFDEMKQLILIEGLPGTGKTTIAKWLSKYLQDCGENITLLLEGDERIPCDFYEMAGIPKNDFNMLCMENDDFAETLQSQALKTENYAYLRIDKYPEKIAEQIRRWDMGDERNKRIPVKDYISCALERLNYWVNENRLDSGITIIDSGFLQNPINELLFRKAENNEVRFFVSSISRLIKSLNPICIYLRRKSAGEAISFAKRVKGREWADRVDKLLKEAGCMNLFERRFILELELLALIPHLLCNLDGDDWSMAKKQIENCLREKSFHGNMRI